MMARTRKRLLIGLNAALAAGLAAVCAAALWPAGRAGPAPSASSPSAPAAAAGPKDAKPAAAYAIIHQRNIRRPLFDPPPAKAVERKPPEPKLTIQLTGTVIESASSVGLFRTAGGRHKFAGVGDTVEGAEVLSVVEGQATVKFQGRTFTLKVPRKGEL